MRKIREVLRLKYSAHLSHRQIASALQISVGVVSKYAAAAESAGICTWPLSEEISDADLEQRIFKSREDPANAVVSRFVIPDCQTIHNELKRKGVTLQLLWEEYAEVHRDKAYKYTQFCTHYRCWRTRLKTSMRQIHYAGEKMFVDYAGPSVGVINAVTGEVREAQIFVAVLGASSYCYVEATWTQSLPDWIASHVRALKFFGGVPQLIIPDNLKSGVNRACRYEPELNATYADMATHYGAAIIPARPYKPKDKSKVEVGVQVVERWILARLRNDSFFSLFDLNFAINTLTRVLNLRPFKKLEGCRHSQFEIIDKPALQPLPVQDYVYAEWRKVRANIDYHIEVDGHYYSVQHSLVKQELEARVTAQAVEVFHRGERVASHMRSQRRGSHTTCPEHMPKAHRAHLEWSPGRFLNWALEIGPQTRDLVRHLLTHKSHPEQGYRSCLGLLSLERRYGKHRLEAACARAISLGSLTRRSVDSILKQGLDSLPPVEDEQPQPLTGHHPNIRGSAYYASADEQPELF